MVPRRTDVPLGTGPAAEHGGGGGDTKEDRSFGRERLVRLVGAAVLPQRLHPVSH